MRYIIPVFFFCFLTYSQTNDTLYNKTKKVYDFSSKLDSLSKLKQNFNYNFKVNNIPLFSVYNHNTQLNDIYYLPINSIYFVKSVNINANQLTQKDSYNPNGVSNLQTGIIMGGLKTVFNYKFRL